MASNFASSPSHSSLLKLQQIPVAVTDEIYRNYFEALLSEFGQNKLKLMYAFELSYWWYIDHKPKFLKITFEELIYLMLDRQPQIHILTHEVPFLMDTFHRVKQLTPTAGAIVLDPDLKYVLLIRSPRGRTWFFPKGKRNEGESSEECAIREVKEEVDLDIVPYLLSTEYIEYTYKARRPLQPLSPACSNGNSFQESVPTLATLPSSSNGQLSALASLATCSNTRTASTTVNSMMPDLGDIASVLEQPLEKTERLYIIPGVPIKTHLKTNSHGEVEECRWFDISQVVLFTDRFEFGRLKLIIRDVQSWIYFYQKKKMLRGSVCREIFNHKFGKLPHYFRAQKGERPEEALNGLHMNKGEPRSLSLMPPSETMDSNSPTGFNSSSSIENRESPSRQPLPSGIAQSTEPIAGSTPLISGATVVGSANAVPTLAARVQERGQESATQDQSQVSSEGFEGYASLSDVELVGELEAFDKCKDLPELIQRMGTFRAPAWKKFEFDMDAVLAPIRALTLPTPAALQPNPIMTPN